MGKKLYGKLFSVPVNCRLTYHLHFALFTSVMYVFKHVQSCFAMITIEHQNRNTVVRNDHRDQCNSVDFLKPGLN